MRQDIDLDTNGFQYFYLQMYGTAVKILDIKGKEEKRRQEALDNFIAKKREAAMTEDEKNMALTNAVIDDFISSKTEEMSALEQGIVKFVRNRDNEASLMDVYKNIPKSIDEREIGLAIDHLQSLSVIRNTGTSLKINTESFKS